MRRLVELNPSVPEFSGAEDDAEVTFIPLEAVWPNERLDTSRVRPKRELATGYTRFREGDVLLPKITPTFEADRSTMARGLRNGFAAGTTELHVLRPRPGIDPRYINYLVSSRPFLQEGAASLIGVAGQKRVPEEFVECYRACWPPLDEQRRIADRLDAETARIDALIAKRLRQIELLAERRAVRVEMIVRSLSARHGSSPLRYSTRRIEVGIVVTPAHWYEHGAAGVPAIRGVDVTPGRISTSDLVNLSAVGHRLNRKSTLRRGDLVVVRTGQAGAAAVVPAELDGANCIDLLIVRPSASLDAHYLELVLNSDWTRKHITEHSVGTIQSHFNVSSMRAVPLPVPSISLQREVLRDCASLASDERKVRSLLTRQIELLRERRQTLITAAVSGELAID